MICERELAAMKSRQEIKALAREGMAHQLGTAILILFLYSLIYYAGIVVGNGIGGIGAAMSMRMFHFSPNVDPLSIVRTWTFLGGLVTSATFYFIDLPLMVNMCGTYIKVYTKEETGVDEMFTNFPVNYLRKVGGMSWMWLWVGLWTLLFIIPGIVKWIAYSMTRFILAQYPNVTATQALKLSMRMTNGYKGRLFVMYLSFIGWLILSMFTFGILYIVYVGPYMYTTMAGFYVELRDNALASGTIQQSELEPA